MRPAGTDLDALASAGERFERECAQVGDRWADPTPCTEWDAGQLVDHVIGGNRFTVGVLSGQSADDALRDAIASFGPDAGSGAGRLAAAAASIRDQLDAFTQPGALERRCHHVAGELAGTDVCRLRIHDLIVHGWDLAQALHPPADVPGDLVTWALAELSAGDSLSAQLFGVDPASLASSPEPPHVALLTAFGRSI
jgi:uncharacterized protein (TIGR03086 family)